MKNLIRMIGPIAALTLVSAKAADTPSAQPAGQRVNISQVIYLVPTNAPADSAFKDLMNIIGTWEVPIDQKRLKSPLPKIGHSKPAGNDPEMPVSADAQQISGDAVVAVEKLLRALEDKKLLLKQEQWTVNLGDGGRDQHYASGHFFSSDPPEQQADWFYSSALQVNSFQPGSTLEKSMVLKGFASLGARTNEMGEQGVNYSFISPRYTVTARTASVFLGPLAALSEDRVSKFPALLIKLTIKVQD